MHVKFNSYKFFSISTKYTSAFFILTIVTHATQEGLKLIATNSLRVTTLSFIEIDNIPNRIEVLRVQRLVKIIDIYYKNLRRPSH